MTRLPRRLAPLEDVIQRQILALFELILHPDVMVFHVPNGGERNAIVGARMKRSGVKRGVPDLVLLAPGGRTHFIEVKRPGEKLTVQQEAFRDFCAFAGFPWSIAFTMEDARDAVIGWNLTKT